MMAARLLCKRLVSLPKLSLSFRRHNPWRPTSLEKALWLYDVDDWSKEKDPWEEDDIITDESDEEISDSALTHKDSESTTTEESSENSESTTKEKCPRCSLGQSYNRAHTDKGRFLLRLHKIDCGPNAYAHRTQTYNAYLWLLVVIHDHQIARSYLADMIVNGAIPDLTTFSILIRPYCRHLKYQSLLHVLHTEMKALGVEADDYFYKTLIHGVCVRFGPNVGYQLLDELRLSRGIQMPLSCYDAVVRQFCRKKTTVTSGLIDVLMDMKQQRLFPDNKIYNFLIRGQRYHGDDGFFKAASIGRQMFTQGMKIGALSIIVQKKGPRKFRSNK